MFKNITNNFFKYFKKKYKIFLIISEKCKTNISKKRR